MTQEDIDLLIQLCSIQSTTTEDTFINTYIKQWIVTNTKCTVVEDKFGNMYVTKGKAATYPCFVSHTDTVHAFRQDYAVEQRGNYLIAFDGPLQTGVGGDDRCGIWACLKALQILSAVKVVFFRFEESGMKGSREADMQFFTNTRFVLQFDRKGNDEWITYSNGTNMISPEFKEKLQPIITSYGYKFATGIATDVGQLIHNGLPVCAANLGCGYYNPHTSSEYICLSDLANCWEMAVHVCAELTDVAPFTKASLPEIPSSDFSWWQAPNRYKRKDYQSIYDAGWRHVADNLLELSATDFEEAINELQMEYLDDRSKYVPPTTGSGCSVGKCWANLLPDRNIGGDPILSCIICHKEFPDDNRNTKLTYGEHDLFGHNSTSQF